MRIDSCPPTAAKPIVGCWAVKFSKIKNMQNKVQGDYPLELKFVEETRVYLNFWNSNNGQDICCQIKDGKIFKFVYSPTEVEADEIKDESEIDDVFEQTEISINEFLMLVQGSILGKL